MSSIEKRTWGEFREAGLLWWVNRILHIFGWCIVVELDDSGDVQETYPVRTTFTHFSSECEQEGYKNLRSFIEHDVGKKEN